MTFTRNRRSMDDTPVKGNNDRKPSIRDLVQTIEFPKKAKFLTVRLYQGVVPVGVHMYPLFKKDGEPVMNKYDKQSQIEKICLAFDPETMERDTSKKCPYCDAEMYFKVDYWAEGLIREEVEAEPAKHKPSKEEAKTGFKDKDNEASWTPVRAHKLTARGYEKLKNLKQLNKVKIDGERVPVAVDDEENGCDVNMNFDGDATGDSMYGMQKGDQSPMTEEELAYLRWDIESAVEAATESLDEAQRNADWYNKHAGNTSDADGDDEYEPEEGDHVFVIDEDDERHEGKVTEATSKVLVIEDEDGDTHTFRRSKIEQVGKLPAKKGKAKPAKDEDEDDKPAPKSKGKAKPAPEDADNDYEPDEGNFVSVTDSDDEETLGTVVSINARLITIEDKDEETHKFKRADVTIKAAEKPKAKGNGKPAPAEAEDDADADEYTPEEGDMVIVTDSDDEEVKGKVVSVTSKLITIEDEDDETHKFKLADVTVTPAPTKSKAKGKAKPAPDEDDEDEDEDDKPTKAKGKAKPAEDEDDEDDDKPAPKRKTSRNFDFDD